MKFMLMIFGNEAEWQKLPQSAMGEMLDAHNKFSEEFGKAGKLIGGDALQPEATGQRVKLTNGKRAVIDGPFAETKEVIGGYYLVDVASRDEAVEIAKKVPLIDGEFVEVRPVMTFG